MLYATLREDTTTGDVLLETRYDEDFVGEFKEAVPWRLRQWEKDRRQWRIKPDGVDVLLAFLTDYGCTVVDKRPSPAPAAPALPAHPDVPADLLAAFTFLRLQPDAPLGLAELAFSRWWAKHYHPDSGGNEAAFKEANNAISCIRKYLG